MASCGGCCGSDVKFEGLSPDYKRRLWAVIAINAGMFFVETAGGHLAGSNALQADALDFLGDALTYGITLAAIGAAAATRAKAALFKGFTLFLMGLWVFGSTAYHVSFGRSPCGIDGRNWFPRARCERYERALADEIQGWRCQRALRLAMLPERRHRQRRGDGCGSGRLVLGIQMAGSHRGRLDGRIVPLVRVSDPPSIVGGVAPAGRRSRGVRRLLLLHVHALVRIVGFHAVHHRHVFAAGAAAHGHAGLPV